MSLERLKFTHGEFTEFRPLSEYSISPVKIPNYTGLYAIKLRQNDLLTYIGKSGGAKTLRVLRDRFEQDHFREYSRGSQLRRDIATHLGLPLLKTSDGKHKYAASEHEPQISQFLILECFVAFLEIARDNILTAEKDAIKQLDPLWNKQHNTN